MRILYIEDNEDDVRLAREFLHPAEFDLVCAPCAADARKRLEETDFDAVLLDHGLPDSNSLVFLAELRVLFPELPVIVLTGREDEVLAVSVLSQGAACYLNKKDMAGKICEAIRKVVEDRKGAERDGAPRSGAQGEISDRAEHISRFLLSMMNEGCLLVDIDGVITFANEAAERMLEAAENGLLGRPVSELFDETTAQRFIGFFSVSSAGDQVAQEKYEGRLKTDKEVFLSWLSLHNRLGRHEACLVMIADISELIEMRDSLKQRLGEVERFQRFFIEREHRIIELKAKIRDYEHRLGIGSKGLSEETHREIDRRLGII